MKGPAAASCQFTKDEKKTELRTKQKQSFDVEETATKYQLTYPTNFPMHIYAQYTLPRNTVRVQDSLNHETGQCHMFIFCHIVAGDREVSCE